MPNPTASSTANYQPSRFISQTSQDMPPHPAPLTKVGAKGKATSKSKSRSTQRKLSAYEIEREKNITENKLLLAKAKETVLKEMGISVPLPPLFPKQMPKEKAPQMKCAPLPANQLRHGHSAGQ
jgi:hypothetical protein